LHHPAPAIARAALSSRNRIPTFLPRGASWLYAVAFRAQILSRADPCQIKVVPAKEAMIAPKNKKIPIAIIPRVDIPRTTLFTLKP
jgi:hypothetical protein